MSLRLRLLLWVILISFVLAGVELLRRARAVNQVLSLEQICVIAQEGRFADAQESMTAFLKLYPEHPRANLLMAQFCLDRPDPQPHLVFKHLGQVRTGSAKDRAIVLFYMGKAHYFEKRYDLAEKQWIKALELDATVPEAGWALFDLLDVESRLEEARSLGLWIHQNEPDPRERVRALLELCRLDLDRVAPESVVPIFQPLHLEHPEDLTIALVTGRALIRNSQLEEGVETLRNAVQGHPASAKAWDNWLSGLSEASRTEDFLKELSRLPSSIKADPRFAKHRGFAAEFGREWPLAAQAYQQAYDHEPFNKTVLNRLRIALRLTGQTLEAEQLDRKFQAFQDALKELQEVHAKARTVRTLGLEPHPELYHQLAELRERVGRTKEAVAWHRLVLQDSPSDPVSLAALKRLTYDQTDAQTILPIRLIDIFQD